jgi:hypothetical protein
MQLISFDARFHCLFKQDNRFSNGPENFRSRSRQPQSTRLNHSRIGEVGLPKAQTSGPTPGCSFKSQQSPGALPNSSTSGI